MSTKFKSKKKRETTRRTFVSLGLCYEDSSVVSCAVMCTFKQEQMKEMGPEETVEKK